MSLGKVARSTSSTLAPRRASSIASGAPAQRAPTTMTSNIRPSSKRQLSGRCTQATTPRPSIACAERSPHPRRGLLHWFKQLNRIPVRVFDLDLSATRTHFHVVAKMKSRLLQPVDARWQIVYAQNDPVPAARLLTFPVGHRTRTGGAWATEEKSKRTERDIGKGRELLVLERESKKPGVERGRAAHVRDLISHPVKVPH